MNAMIEPMEIGNIKIRYKSANISGFDMAIPLRRDGA